MSHDATRRDEDHELKVGFAGEQKTLKVRIPDGDLKPWDYDTKFQTVGTAVDRVDAVAKVTGRAKYAYDINLPGLCYGVMLRASIARGKVQAIDVEAAKAMPGVKAVLALKRPGERVRWVGDEVAAVAAETIDLARDALARIQVTYDAEAHNTDLLKAEAAPKVDADGQVTDPWPERNADRIEKGLGEADVRVEATYRCEVQTHSSLESHGCTASWNEARGELEIWASTQATFGWRQGIATALRLPADKVLVHTEFMGGGFGSKFSPGAEGLAAARLTREAKVPVKLMLDRYEEHTCAGNRPSALMRIRLGAKKDGTLTALDYQSWGGPGYGGGGNTRAPSCYFGGKPTRNTQNDLQTDTDAGRAMRAPGWPQGHFATEHALDEMAAALQLDPLVLRQKNDGDVVRQWEWQLGAEKFGWASKRNPKPGTPRAGQEPHRLRGAGCSSAAWGQLGGPGSRVLCRIHKDGSVEVRNGAQDLGTGLKTVLAILTAEELGIPVTQVRAFLGDTRDPQGPGSGGSTTTPSVAPAARHAAGLARQQLEAIVAEHLGVDPVKVASSNGRIGTPEKTLSFAEACKLMTVPALEAVGERKPNYATYKGGVFGCQFAEVEVDTRTGLVQVLSMLAVQDCGLVLAKKLAESQVIGAMIQGLSYALLEQRIVDHKSGRVLNGDFLNYKIATSADMPPMQAIMVSVANGGNNVGAAGLGEPPAVAPAAAVANAVQNAIGAPVRSLPITPDKVKKALAARKGV